MFKPSKFVFVAVASALLSGCGGSGSGDGQALNDQNTGYANCSAPDANQKLYNYMKDWYFWNDDLPSSFNPESQPDIPNALNALISGVSKDRFSFSMTTAQYDAYQKSEFFGYGFSHQINDDKTGLLIRYTYTEGTPYQVGLRRGDTITAINDIPMSQIIAEVEAGNKTFNDYFGPNEEGYSIVIDFTKSTGEQRQGEITKGKITANTVMATDTLDASIDGKAAKVGYIAFNSFDEISETELETSFATLQQESVDELVLDLRYNSGGLIRVANQLSTQIAGTNVENDVFVTYAYNDSKSSQNQTLYFGLGQGISQLDLNRVVVLTSEMSCSSSELVINGLAPHIDVVQIGDTTCGKPVGMAPQNICNDVVFAINFESQNSESFGDYYDGLQPQCSAVEKVVGDWGDVNDPLLAEGLTYLETGACSTNASSQSIPDFKKPTVDWREGPFAGQNRI